MQNSSKKRKVPVWRTIYRIVILLLISLLIGGTIYSINARRVLNNQMPMPLGFGFSYVLSPSMEPTLHVDDLVLVRTADTYSVDDIVIYQEDAHLVIHRIVEVIEEEDGIHFITKGDNNNTVDLPIKASDVKGKLVFSVRYLGSVVRVLQTTLGKLVLIGVAALLFLLSLKREKKKDDKELENIKEEIRKLKELQSQSEQPGVPAPDAAVPQPANLSPEQSSEAK